LPLDEATKNMTFLYLIRILIDDDLSFDLCKRILIERDDFVFYVDVEYERESFLLLLLM